MTTKAELLIEFKRAFALIAKNITETNDDKLRILGPDNPAIQFFAALKLLHCVINNVPLVINPKEVDPYEKLLNEAFLLKESFWELSEFSNYRVNKVWQLYQEFITPKPIASAAPQPSKVTVTVAAHDTKIAAAAPTIRQISEPQLIQQVINNLAECLVSSSHKSFSISRKSADLILTLIKPPLLLRMLIPASDNLLINFMRMQEDFLQTVANAFIDITEFALFIKAHVFRDVSDGRHIGPYLGVGVAFLQNKTLVNIIEVRLLKTADDYLKLIAISGYAALHFAKSPRFAHKLLVDLQGLKLTAAQFFDLIKKNSERSNAELLRVEHPEADIRQADIVHDEVTCHLICTPECAATAASFISNKKDFDFLFNNAPQTLLNIVSDPQLAAQIFSRVFATPGAKQAFLEEYLKLDHEQHRVKAEIFFAMVNSSKTKLAEHITAEQFAKLLKREISRDNSILSNDAKESYVGSLQRIDIWQDKLVADIAENPEAAQALVKNIYQDVAVFIAHVKICSAMINGLIKAPVGTRNIACMLFQHKEVVIHFADKFNAVQLLEFRAIAIVGVHPAYAIERAIRGKILLLPSNFFPRPNVKIYDEFYEQFPFDPAIPAGTEITRVTSLPRELGHMIAQFWSPHPDPTSAPICSAPTYAVLPSSTTAVKVDIKGDEPLDCGNAASSPFTRFNTMR